MKLRQTEALGILDEHYNCVRNVYADLYNRGRYKQINVSGGKFAHHGILFLRFHLTVQQTQAVVFKFAGFEIFVVFGRCRKINLFVFLYGRTDDITLSAVVKVLFYIGICAAALVGPYKIGLYRLPAVWQ